MVAAQVQYEALRDDHCFDPKGAAKSTLYCSKNAGDHGRPKMSWTWLVVVSHPDGSIGSISFAGF